VEPVRNMRMIMSALLPVTQSALRFYPVKGVTLSY
jgi:hypothetical protein